MYLTGIVLGLVIGASLTFVVLLKVLERRELKQHGKPGEQLGGEPGKQSNGDNK